jgi:hypothetical protein
MIADKAVSDQESQLTWTDLQARMTHLFPCPECGRLWVYWDGMASEPTSYARE